MGNNHRPQTTATRSISFDLELLERIDKECADIRMGRSEFIQELALMYFNDRPIVERAKRLHRWADTVNAQEHPIAPVKLARKTPASRK